MAFSMNRRNLLSGIAGLPFVGKFISDAKSDVIAVPPVVSVISTIEELVAHISSRYESGTRNEPTFDPSTGKQSVVLADGTLCVSEYNLSYAATGEPFVNIGWHADGIEQPIKGVQQEVYIDDALDFVPIGDPCKYHMEDGNYWDGIGYSPRKVYFSACRCKEFKFVRNGTINSRLKQMAPILYYRSEKEAVKAALSAFNAYAANRKGKVYWRYLEKASLVWRDADDLRDDHNPALLKASGQLKPDDLHDCRVELRLLISDKRPLG